MATDGTSSDDGTGLNFGNEDSGIGSLQQTAGTVADGAEYDEHGTRYDPAIHSPNRKRNKDGSWRNRKGSGTTRSSNSASSSTRGKQTQGQISVSGIETLLVGIFAGVSAFTRCPELALEADESGPLARATAEVAALYPMPDMTEKAVKWTALAMTAGPMFMAKFMLIKQRKENEKAEAAKSVTPFQ